MAAAGASVAATQKVYLSIDVGMRNTGVAIVRSTPRTAYSWTGFADEQPRAPASRVGREDKRRTECPQELADMAPFEILTLQLVDFGPDLSVTAQCKSCVHKILSNQSIIQWLPDVTDVIIEDQAVARGPVQCVGAALQTLFHTLVTTGERMRPDATVTVKNARYKLGVLNLSDENKTVSDKVIHPPLPVSPPPTPTAKHAYNKAMSVNTSMHILSFYGMDNACKHIASLQKADDVSDAFLQALAVMRGA